jgi:hypothetical protein
MLTVQLVAAIPPFVLVVGCLSYSFWIVYVQSLWLVYLQPHVVGLGILQTWFDDPTGSDGQHDARTHFAKSLLPAGLLVIGLQGLLGALVWPAVALLTITAYLGTSLNSSQEIAHEQRTPGSVVAKMFVVIVVVLFIGIAPYFITAYSGLFFGTAWIACWIAVACFVVFMGHQRWEYEEDEGVATARACSEQFAQGQADEALAAGTRLHVSPYGEGVYERFERNTFGANDHYICFGSGGTKKVALNKLQPQEYWTVLALAAEQAAKIAGGVWREYKDEDSKTLEKQWQKDDTILVSLIISNPAQPNLSPAGYTHLVNLERMEQKTLATGTKRNIRRTEVTITGKPGTTLSSITQELGTPEMCLVYTLLLAFFWLYTVFKTWFDTGGSTTDLPLTEHMCERLYQPDGTERFGHVLDVDLGSSVGWDIALFLMLLLHRHRLRRRGEWSDALNSDLSKLAGRSFSLLPPIKFWDHTLLDPLKQYVAVPVQEKVKQKSVIGVELSTWTMVSGLLVLMAASLGLMCVFDEIPVALRNTDGPTIGWTGQATDGCPSDYSAFLMGIAVFVVFFAVVGLVSWAVVCDTSGIKAKKREDEAAVIMSDPDHEDGYIPILVWQLVALPLVVALYFERTGQSASQISQSVTQSSTVPTSIVALGCGVFLLIIADRAVYVLEASTFKLLILWASLLAFCAFWISGDSLNDDQSDSAESFSWTGSWSVRLMVACCMYFYQSAVQLESKLKRNPKRRYTRYSKVPGDKNTWVHTLRRPIRQVPFLMELVYLVRQHLRRWILSAQQKD